MCAPEWGTFWLVSFWQWSQARLHCCSFTVSSPSWLDSSSCNPQRLSWGDAEHRDFYWSRHADDVALLAEMLEVLLLALDVLNDEARPLGIEVNWQSTIDSATTPSSVYISGNPVEVVESFVYLGSEIHSSGSSEPEVLRRIGLAKSCFNLLNRGIWLSLIHIWRCRRRG